MKFVPVVLGLLLACSAQAAHVTDKLLAGFYAEAGTDALPLRALPSGTPLEVLERGDNFIRVRLSDGAEGWIEAQYVSEEKPARAMLVEAQARNGELQKEMKQLRLQLETIANRDAQPDEADEALAAAQARVIELERQLVEAAKEHIPGEASEGEVEAAEQAVRITELETALAEAQDELEAVDEDRLSALEEENRLLREHIAQAVGLLSQMPPTAEVLQQNPARPMWDWLMSSKAF